MGLVNTGAPSYRHPLSVGQRFGFDGHVKTKREPTRPNQASSRLQRQDPARSERYTPPKLPTHYGPSGKNCQASLCDWIMLLPASRMLAGASHWGSRELHGSALHPRKRTADACVCPAFRRSRNDSERLGNGQLSSGSRIAANGQFRQ